MRRDSRLQGKCDRPPFPSYGDALRTDLADVERQLLDVLDASSVEYVNPNTSDSGVFFVGAADYGWARSNDALAAARMRALDNYIAWHRRLTRLLPRPTPDLQRRLQAADDLIRRWLERPDTYDHDIPATVDAAKGVLQSRVQALRELVELASGDPSGSLRLVPDTNSVLRNPDLASYWRGAGTGSYGIHLVPTVLRELDQLKDRGATAEVRDKAQAFIRRLKGLRDKGPLANGVALSRMVIVKAEPVDVDPPTMLDWLDRSVADDRILAAALDLQARYPSDAVVLVTSDLNLQNKADAAGVSYIETPPHPASLRAKLAPTFGERPSKEIGVVLVVEMRNDGPQAARDLTYSVTTVGGPPCITAGPWHVAELPSGGVDRRDLTMLPRDGLLVAATWEDGDGSHEQRWPPTRGDG